MRLFILVASLLTATLTYSQDSVILRNGEEIPAKVLEVNQTELKYRKSANLEGPIYTSPLRDVLLIKYANGTKDTFGNDRPFMRNRPSRSALEAPGMPPAPTDRPPMQGLDGLRYHRGLFSRYYVGNTGQHIGVSDANSLFYGTPDALNTYEKGRSLRNWSKVTGITAIGLIGTGAGIALANGERQDRHDAKRGSGDPFDDRRDEQRGEHRDEQRGEHRFGVVGGALAGGGVLLGITSLWLDHRATVQFRRAANRYNTRQPTSIRFIPNQQGVSAVLTF